MLLTVISNALNSLVSFERKKTQKIVLSFVFPQNLTLVPSVRGQSQSSLFNKIHWEFVLNLSTCKVRLQYNSSSGMSLIKTDLVCRHSHQPKIGPENWLSDLSTNNMTFCTVLRQSLVLGLFLLT